MALLKKLRTKIFFWTKKEAPKPRGAEMIETFIKYLPDIQKAVRAEQRKSHSDSDLLKRMYDFYEDAGGVTENGFDGGANPRLPLLEGEDGYLPPPADTRLAKKPMEVAGELDRVPHRVDLEHLDEKINLFKSKSALLNQRFAKSQVEGFIQRLNNRRHYAAHHKFFEQFPITFDEHIDALLGKYKLVMKESDLFVPTFPKEAVDVMKRYTAETQKFTDEAPVFYVIAEEADFEKKFKKLDPILLVQSPFGFYWQILGAWDKEMLLLSEL